MAANRTDEIVELLRTKITSQQLVPGDALAREELLAQDYNVSRACIRESLAILKAQGYLISKRGKYGGTFISTLVDSGEVDSLYRDLVLMDQMKISEILAARLLIEPEAARSAASASAQTRFESYIATSDAQQELGAYFNFHNSLGKNSQNPFYDISIRSFIKFTSTFMEVLHRTNQSISLYNKVLQQDVINAIETHNSSLAYEKMYLYTALSKDKILQLEPLFHKVRETALKERS